MVNSLNLSKNHFHHEQFSIEIIYNPVLFHKVIEMLKYMNVIEVLLSHDWKTLFNLKTKPALLFIEHLLSGRHCTRSFAHVCSSQHVRTELSLCFPSLSLTSYLDKLVSVLSSQLWGSWGCCEGTPGTLQLTSSLYSVALCM